MDGERVASNRKRRGFVPSVSEARPMVWKEMFIERVHTLGRFGRWAGLLLVTVLVVGSVGLTAVVAFGSPTPGSPSWSDWARDQLEIWVGGSGWWLACLIQWAVGLRASVSISSERERGTWDALMTSPLDGKEIVRAKLRGSLFALRGLIAAAFIAWSLSAAVGALPLRDVVVWGADVLVVGAFMAAVGVRTSLACQTATRAMALTVGIWLGAWVFVAVAAFSGLASATLIGNALRMAAGELGLLPPQTAFWAPVPWFVAWPIARYSVYLLATALIVADTRLRFDRLAGRMTEGAAAVAFEALVHGRPEPMIFIDPDIDPLEEPLSDWAEPAVVLEPTEVRQEG
jgi:ABC-type transport system involved in multi-copper enzyme maturation permease subunit